MISGRPKNIYAASGYLESLGTITPPPPRRHPGSTGVGSTPTRDHCWRVRLDEPHHSPSRTPLLVPRLYIFVGVARRCLVSRVLTGQPGGGGTEARTLFFRPQSEATP